MSALLCPGYSEIFVTDFQCGIVFPACATVLSESRANRKLKKGSPLATVRKELMNRPDSQLSISR